MANFFLMVNDKGKPVQIRTAGADRIFFIVEGMSAADWDSLPVDVKKVILGRSAESESERLIGDYPESQLKSIAQAVEDHYGRGGPIPSNTDLLILAEGFLCMLGIERSDRRD